MAEVKEELSKPQTPSLADLLIAYYNQRNAGAWSNKARTGNLKQFAEAVNYLTENKLLTLEDLQERLSSVSEEFEALSGSMKKKSARIKELQELIREGENYQRLKPVHTELNNIKFKNCLLYTSVSGLLGADGFPKWQAPDPIPDGVQNAEPVP